MRERRAQETVDARSHEKDARSHEKDARSHEKDARPDCSRCVQPVRASMMGRHQQGLAMRVRKNCCHFHLLS